jgi:hypothetical protein
MRQYKKNPNNQSGLLPELEQCGVNTVSDESCLVGTIVLEEAQCDRMRAVPFGQSPLTKKDVAMKDVAMKILVHK